MAGELIGRRKWRGNMQIKPMTAFWLFIANLRSTEELEDIASETYASLTGRDKTCVRRPISRRLSSDKEVMVPLGVKSAFIVRLMERKA